MQETDSACYKAICVFFFFFPPKQRLVVAPLEASMCLWEKVEEKALEWIISVIKEESEGDSISDFFIF